MRVVIQRVLEASVSVGGAEVSRIGAGLLLLVGVAADDGEEDIEWLVGKVARLRIFDDEAGVMNLDVREAGGSALVVSQFTLLASTHKGNRPSWIRAARPEVAEPLYERFVSRLESELGQLVATGVFGADMRVSLVNNGPVTILIDSKSRE